jgi:two-component system sensor histidine kinase ChvG
MRGPRSLRWNALAVVVSLALFPLVYIVTSGGIETFFVRRTLSRAVGSADVAVRALQGGDPSAAQLEIDAIAQSYDQRIRVVRGNRVILDSDHVVGDSWLFQLGDVFYGPGRAAGIADVEQRDGPVPERPEVARAFATGSDAGCEHSVLGNLQICHAVRRVNENEGPPVIVHVQGSSRRALEALYDSRRQLVKLTAFVLALGLVLAWWMGRRMVRPVEDLRAEVLRRARAAVPRAELPVAREDEVGELTLAFNALLSALAERSRANEAFVADLAHEFKNPVAAIRACAERLGGEGLDEARAKRLGDVLQTSSRRLDTLVTQFLELARAEAGLPNEAREDVDVAALARGIAEAGAKPARVEAPERRVDVRGVPHRLEAALRNLIDNATHFAPEGSEVVVTVAESGGKAEITVDDAGPGIAKEDLPRVFERFFTKRAEGTGLGLALTRAVVEAHGGTVRAESPGALGGARFVIVLPLS